MQILYASLLAVTSALIQSCLSSSIAYEQPLHTVLVCLLASALSIRTASAWFPQILESKNEDIAEYELMKEGGPQTPSDRRDDGRSLQGPLNSPSSKYAIACGIAALALRVEIFRRSLQFRECTSETWEVFVPFVFSIYDWKTQSPRELVKDDQPDANIYDDSATAVWNFLLRPKLRYSLPAFLVAIGCYAAAGLWLGHTSTAVCPISSGHAAWIPRLQFLGVFLDCVVCVAVDSLATSSNSSHTSKPSAPTAYSHVLVGTAGILGITASLPLFVNRHYIRWLILFDNPDRLRVLLSILWQAILFSLFLVIVIRYIHSQGVFHVSILLTIWLSTIAAVQAVWAARKPYPPMATLASLWSFPILITGLWLYMRIRHTIAPSSVTRYGTNLLLLAMVPIAVLLPWLMKSTVVHYHPIDLLLYDARQEHDQYSRFATHSNNLSTAVSLYRKRYQSNPPPRFDVWWKFAQERGATITDDFDQIYMDLLPFRTVPAADLRKHLRDAASDPKNNIASIRIRSGQATIHADELATHTWMLDGVVQMMDSFVRHIPDVDIAINLDETPRVTLPYEEMSAIRRQAESINLYGTKHWTKQNDIVQSSSSEQIVTSNMFENWSHKQTFAALGARSCPPGSRSRKQHVNMFQSHTCVSCAASHSFGQFVSNWSLAASPCHQPDLAQLHGFFLSPEVFKPSQKLIPIFSSSKAHGFADILYPSAWNYLDHITYKPSDGPITDTITTTTTTTRDQQAYPDLPFSQKVDALYWRGGTTEGISPGNGVWRGMARQRLVHMTNNLTTSYHDHATLLLPHPDRDGKYSYQTLSAAELLKLRLRTDIHFEDHISHCAASDCTDQHSEFGTVPPANFQNHWKYKFILDLDGAGSTGHFIPFLKSNSVPFKAGLFREWYDTRLTPWRHFVPQDLRFHSLWSTLAYFAGINVDNKMKWQAHTKEAELIAREGKEWAEKVLRKEDMEIYMFRLLLEWARLTDDMRDELGFVVD